MATPQQQVVTPISQQQASGSTAATTNIYSRAASQNAKVLGMEASTLQALSGLGDSYIKFKQAQTNVEIKDAVLRAKVHASAGMAIPQDEVAKDNRFYQQAFAAQAAHIQGGKVGQALLASSEKMINSAMETWDNAKKNNLNDVTSRYSKSLEEEITSITGEMGIPENLRKHPAFIAQLTQSSNQIHDKFVGASQIQAVQQRKEGYQKTVREYLSKVTEETSADELLLKMQLDRTHGLPTQTTYALFAEGLQTKISGLVSPDRVGEYNSKDLGQATTLLKLLQTRMVRDHTSIADLGGINATELASLNNQISQYENAFINDDLARLRREQLKNANNLTQWVNAGGVSKDQLSQETRTDFSKEITQEDGRIDLSKIPISRHGKFIAHFSLNGNASRSILTLWKEARIREENANYLKDFVTQTPPNGGTLVGNAGTLLEQAKKLLEKHPDSTHAQKGVKEAVVHLRTVQREKNRVIPAIVDIPTSIQDAANSQSIETVITAIKNMKSNTPAEAQKRQAFMEKVLTKRKGIKIQEAANEITTYTILREKMKSANPDDLKSTEIARKRLDRAGDFIVGEFGTTEELNLNEMKKTLASLKIKDSSTVYDKAVTKINERIQTLRTALTDKALSTNHKESIRTLLTAATTQQRQLHRFSTEERSATKIKSTKILLEEAKLNQNNGNMDAATTAADAALTGLPKVTEKISPLQIAEIKRLTAQGKAIKRGATAALLYSKMNTSSEEGQAEIVQKKYIDKKGDLDKKTLNTDTASMTSNQREKYIGIVKMYQTLAATSKDISTLDGFNKDNVITKDEASEAAGIVPSIKKALSQIKSDTARSAAQRSFQSVMEETQRVIKSQMLDDSVNFVASGMYWQKNDFEAYKKSFKRVRSLLSQNEISKIEGSITKITKERKAVQTKFGYEWEDIASKVLFSKQALMSDAFKKDFQNKKLIYLSNVSGVIELYIEKYKTIPDESRFLLMLEKVLTHTLPLNQSHSRKRGRWFGKQVNLGNTPVPFFNKLLDGIDPTSGFKGGKEDAPANKEAQNKEAPSSWSTDVIKTLTIGIDAASQWASEVLNLGIDRTLDRRE